MPRQRRKSTEDDENEDDHFEHAQNIEQSDAPLRERGVKADAEGYAGDGDAAGGPTVGLSRAGRV